MIGAFARMVGQRNHVLACQQTSDHAWRVETRGASGLAATEQQDAPPEAFVERVPHEGGDVFLSPLVETLLNVLRGRARPAETLPRTSDNP